MRNDSLDPGRARGKPHTGLLIFFLLVRTLVNTVHRMVYPFLPVLARAFGVSPAALSAAASVRSLAGLGSIFLSRYTDSRGRKFGMLLGNALFLSGMAVIVLWPSFPSFILGLGLSSLGKYVLDAAIYAFVGDEIPANRRGRAFGIIELGWSLSYLAGIAGVRVLLERSGWLAPFPILGVLGVVAWAGFVVLVPAGRRTAARPDPIRVGVGAILRNRAAVLVLLVSVVINVANELVTLVFAVWLEDNFGFALAGLAGAALVIGFAELSGESLVGVLTDRLGSLRAVRWGLLLNCLFAFLLPLVGRTPAGAFVGLFLFYLTFEFTIVSGISLLTEVPTKSRATLMSFNVVCVSVGRIVSAWAALPIYTFGFAAVLAVAVLVNLAGLGALRGLVRELDANNTA
ncbi:MAG TPA: MFS transporter [Anaerolineales bacterium]|nr:MFS transporter [Anaerolineales bacterium]